MSPGRAPPRGPVRRWTCARAAPYGTPGSVPAAGGPARTGERVHARSGASASTRSGGPTVGDRRSVPEPSSVGGSPMGGRDPWAGFAAGPPSGSYPRLGNGSDAPGDDRAVADLARRLQDRVDGQEALLERVAVLAQLSDDRARIAELRDIGRRLHREGVVATLHCPAALVTAQGGGDPWYLGDSTHLMNSTSSDSTHLMASALPGSSLPTRGSQRNSADELFS